MWLQNSNFLDRGTIQFYNQKYFPVILDRSQKERSLTKKFQDDDRSHHTEFLNFVHCHEDWNLSDMMRDECAFEHVDIEDTLINTLPSFRQRLDFWFLAFQWEFSVSKEDICNQKSQETGFSLRFDTPSEISVLFFENYVARLDFCHVRKKQRMLTNHKLMELFSEDQGSFNAQFDPMIGFHWVLILINTDLCIHLIIRSNDCLSSDLYYSFQDRWAP